MGETRAMSDRIRKERHERAAVGLTAIQHGCSGSAVARAFRMSYDALMTLFEDAGLSEQYAEAQRTRGRNRTREAA